VEFDALPAGTYANHYVGLLEEVSPSFSRPVDLVVVRAARAACDYGPTQRLTVRNYPAPRVGNGIVNWQYSVVESQQQLVLQWFKGMRASAG
jgi:hypothetical protein